jgi:pyruvate kinase
MTTILDESDQTVAQLNHGELRKLHKQVTRLLADLQKAEKLSEKRLSSYPAKQRTSATNLIHYLALRSKDLRPLQQRLARYGLSSLGRCEAHVLASVQQLHTVLGILCGLQSAPRTAARTDHLAASTRTLAANTKQLLGAVRGKHSARIMVTLPSEAAYDAHLIAELLANGTDLMRINCAHDEPQVWLDMINHIRREAQLIGVNCRVLMDLAGPKLRTGALQPGEQVVTWGPQRDAHGRVLQPARVAFYVPSSAALPTGVDATLPVAAHVISSAELGDELLLTDARGKRRRLFITHIDARHFIAEANDTAYAEPGTLLRLKRKKHTLCEFRLDNLPAHEEPLLLMTGDTLLVTASQDPGQPAWRNALGQVQAPASIPCSLPTVLAEVRAGERIWFDDGKLGGIVRQATPEFLEVEITYAKAGGAKLRSDKGINLPDSTLSLPCLTPKDHEDLLFAKEHADLIGLSFVRRPEDVTTLLATLGKKPSRLGIILKIETPQAFRNLANILLTGITNVPLGVMVARGDLAVEVGFARLAEVQEEILWLCEAAHIPVIWGTQVLENLTKKGIATRAEVTDAAMSGRAECVMLNKGPYIVDAVRFLSDVLQRMNTHQSKKRPLLRRLAVSERKMDEQKEPRAKKKANK